jgi:hypothetical protein
MERGRSLVAALGALGIFGFLTALVGLVAGALDGPSCLLTVAVSLAAYGLALAVGHLGDPFELRRREAARARPVRDGSARRRARLAVRAHPEQLVDVARQAEAEPLGDVTLKHLDGFEVKLEDRTTARADEVVVVLALEGSLVSSPVSRGDERMLDEACFDEQRQDAVHRRRMRVCDAAVTQILHQIVHREMAAPQQRRTRNRVAHR